MRTYKEAEQAGKSVGFELVRSVDIATVSPVATPWCALQLSLAPRRSSLCSSQGVTASRGHDVRASTRMCYIIAMP